MSGAYSDYEESIEIENLNLHDIRRRKGSFTNDENEE